MTKKLTVNEILLRLKETHGDQVKLDISTYKNTKIKARFVDEDYGEWWATPNNVIYYKKGHKKRSVEKTRQTWFKKYGVTNIFNLEKNRKKCIESRAVPIEEIKERIKEVHGNGVVIDESTYANTQSYAIFIDKNYGPWRAKVFNVIYGKRNHPERGKKNQIEKVCRTSEKQIGFTVRVSRWRSRH